MRRDRAFRLGRVPVSAVLAVAWLFVVACAVAQDDPLPSWNDGPAKQAILDFVRATTDEQSADFVPQPQRIAVFDQDGTLWVEQPLYTQVVFARDRVRQLAPDHPQWKTEEPFKTLLTGDRDALAMFSIPDFEQVVAETHSGSTLEEFHAIVRRWLATARHPRYRRPYTELVYLPMLETMRHLRDNGYRTYIVTGGGQEFVRAYADEVYGVPPEHVVGSAAKTRYDYDADGRPVLVKLPETILIDDRGGKPQGINFVIGRRPQAAFGNSTGDQQMLEWTQQAGKGRRLMMLVHHDDAEREYAYGPDSPVGTFSDALMAEAQQRGWVVISMQRDWKRIFAFEN